MKNISSIKKDDIKNVQDIFNRAGGSIQVALLLGCHQTAVDLWHKRGVPRAYWDEISDVYDITVESIFRVSEKIRNSRKVSK